MSELQVFRHSQTSHPAHKSFANASFTIAAGYFLGGTVEEAMRKGISGTIRPARAGTKALLLAPLLVLLPAGPAAADVRAGVDAWGRGDYAAAVREWEGPAEAGDPDAMFNLGQAYRLGRGVPADPARAETLYASAAAVGHLQAADNYGLMLFQDGRREAALPYIADAARRGDPRARYLLGVSHFNGDLVARDWPRAYALLTLASGAGLPQAISAIAEMDQAIPLDQRQEGAGLAVEMEQQANAARAREMAAEELGLIHAGADTPPPPPSPAPVLAALPSPSPSPEAARTALTQAASATGTEDPRMAGASFAERPPEAPPAAPEPPRRPAATPAPPAAARPAAAMTGPWRVQLGAFSVPANAERLWARLSTRAELAGARKLLVKEGRISRLLAAGFPTRAAADAACRSLRQSGQDCLVTRE